MFKISKVGRQILTLTRKNLIKTPQRFFSQDYDQAREDLKVVLNEEIVAEEEQEVEKDQFLESFLKKTDWKYNTSLDTTKMTLTRQIQGNTVNVIYHARSPSFQDEEEGQEQEQEEQQEIVDFLVVIQNQNGNQLVVELTSSEGQMTITSLFPSKNGMEYANNKMLSFAGSEYTGPIFESLDENLQDKLLGYLNALGVDEDLAVFVESSSLEHEEALYKNWLKRIDAFVQLN